MRIEKCDKKKTAGIYRGVFLSCLLMALFAFTIPGTVNAATNNAPFIAVGQPCSPVGATQMDASGANILSCLISRTIHACAEMAVDWHKFGARLPSGTGI